MKMIFYKVQCGYDGATMPMMSTKYLLYYDAKKEYDFQKSRKDCTFCNLVKIEVEVLDGDTCDSIMETFRIFD